MHFEINILQVCQCLQSLVFSSCLSTGLVQEPQAEVPSKENKAVVFKKRKDIEDHF